MTASPSSGESGRTRKLWLERRAVAAHVALVIWVPGCIVACWWQVGVALSGDSLGWVYSVMWPAFAVFGTIFWWHLVHDDPATVGRRGLRRLQQAGPPSDGEESERHERALREAEAQDPELAAYNDYLASLANRDRGGTWKVP